MKNSKTDDTQATQERSFVFQDEKSSKFWNITQNDSTVVVWYGKTGANGQSQSKEFADREAASKHLQKLVAEKLGKGYVEQGDSASDYVAPVARVAKVDDESPEVKKQVKKCITLKGKILKYLEKYPHLSEKVPYARPPAKLIMERLHYLESSFKLKLEPCTQDHSDRTASMFSGPLYCSDKYPQIRDEAGNPMIPVLQIDLDWVNRHCQRAFQKELLQMWIDTKWNKHVLRCIPLSDISSDETVPFDWGSLRQVANKRTKQLVVTWPCDPDPKLLVGVTPVGMSCPDISEYLDRSEYKIPSGLDLAIEELESAMEARGAHLFGRFIDRQQDASDFLPYKLFLALADWGAEGSAHIDYLTDDTGHTSFKFSHCAR